MANSGKNTNTSQFFVVLTDEEDKLAKIAGKYVVFGRVKEGTGEEILRRLDDVGGDAINGKPNVSVWIGGCGMCWTRLGLVRRSCISNIVAPLLGRELLIKREQNVRYLSPIFHNWHDLLNNRSLLSFQFPDAWQDEIFQQRVQQYTVFIEDNPSIMTARSLSEETFLLLGEWTQLVYLNLLGRGLLGIYSSRVSLFGDP